MTNSLTPVLAELEAAHQLCEDYIWDKIAVETKYDTRYGGALKDFRGKALVTVAAPGRRKQASWFTAGAWTSESNELLATLAGGSGADERLDQITLADWLLTRDPEEIVKELMHQTVAQLGRFLGSKHLVSESGYHNGEFKYWARTAGFRCTKSSSKGWAYTTPNSEMEAKIKEIAATINQDVLDLTAVPKPKKSYEVYPGSTLKKWGCRCSAIRTTQIVNAVCRSCGHPFEYMDKDKDEAIIKTWLRDGTSNITVR
jgi:hypothetical protein